MSKTLIDYDPASRTETWFHRDPSDASRVYVEEIQDVEPILNHNVGIQNMHDGGAKGLTEYSRKGIKEGWWFVGTIPLTLAAKWLNEEGINIFRKSDWPRVRRKLNDPDFKKLRTGLGRV